MDETTSRTRVVFAGGGTAGHVMPALAIAEELTERGVKPEEILFLGSARGVEGKLLAETQYLFEGLSVSNLRRKINPSAIVHNMRAIAELVTGVAKTLKRFVSSRPQVVVIVGGYAAAPAAFAALILRIPLAIVQTDSVAGVVNRWAAKWAKVSFTANDLVKLPNRRVVGVPVRKEVATVGSDAVERETRRKKLRGKSTRRYVLVLGGSLGAKRLNDAVTDLLHRWKSRRDIMIMHMTGLRQGEAWSLEPKDGRGGIAYQPEQFNNDTATLYAAADVVVARAGAVTCAELGAAGTPSILVPLPNSPGDHQRKNAEALVATGGAVIIADSECDGARLAQELDKLLDESKLDAMRDALKGSIHARASAAIADDLMAWVK